MYANQYVSLINWAFENYPKMPYLVYGPTGIGKTEIPERVATKLQQRYQEALDVKEGDRTEGQKAEVAKGPVGFAYLNFTACEYADLVGLPYAEGDMTVYKPPQWLKEIEKFERGVAVFDEVNRIEVQTRQAYMQILDRRAIGNFHIPKGWVIIQTANPMDEGYQVSDFDKAMVRRSCVLELKADVGVWQVWGTNEYLFDGEPMDPMVLAVATRLTNKGLVRPVEIPVKVEATMYGLQIASEMRRRGAHKVDKQVREQLYAGVLGPEGGSMLEAMVRSDRLISLRDKALKGESLPKESSEVMTDVMFLVHDEVRKSPRKFGEAMAKFWEAIPNDLKPVFAQMSHSFMLQYKKEYASFKQLWRGWCHENHDLLSVLAGDDEEGK